MNPQSNSESSVRVAVVNESGFIREGLCRVIERFKDVSVVASVCCPYQLAEVAQQLCVDVALIDAQLPSRSVYEVTRQLRKSGVKTRVIILSVNPSIAEVRRAIRVGAHGFLLREAGVGELEMALQAAVKGSSFLCPTILKRLSQEQVFETFIQSDGAFIDPNHNRYSLDDIISKALRLGILRQDQ